MPQVVSGFSVTNRCLLYISLFLVPAQAIASIGSILPINVAFLAYNWYTQYTWYIAIRHKQLHALSLLPVHFNQIYAITYVAGVPHFSPIISTLLGLGTAGVMILNSVSAWTSWATNLPEGLGVYQFFFFGWRTLTPDWRTVYLLWQIEDTLLTVLAILMVALGTLGLVLGMGYDEPFDQISFIRRGLVLIFFAVWPLILDVELVVFRNHIESETDMIAVWLFIVQVGLMLFGAFGVDKLLGKAFMALLTFLFGSCSFVKEQPQALARLRPFFVPGISTTDPELATDVPLDSIQRVDS